MADIRSTQDVSIFDEDTLVRAKVSTGQAIYTNLRSNSGTELENGASIPSLSSHALHTRVIPYEPATFSFYTPTIASANNKSMCSLLNNTGSTVKIKIHAIKAINTAVSARVGTFLDFSLQRITGHSAGTLVTILPNDTTDTINANVTARTGSTVSGESTDWLNAIKVTSEELGATGTLSHMGYQVEMMRNGGFLITPNNTKPLVLNVGQGVHVKCNTNDTTGSFNFYFLFTQE